MKRLLYIPLFFMWLLSCEKDSMDPMYMADFRTIEGSWRSIEIERSSIDNKNVWEPIPAAKSDTLIFRGDGVIMDAKGTPRCCSPKSLIINGQLIDIKPQTALPPNPLCSLVNCVNCPIWEIFWSDDQLIISSCNSPRIKYIR